MTGSFAMQFVAAVALALIVVRYWRVIVAVAAVVVLSLTFVGLMTLLTQVGALDR